MSAQQTIVAKLGASEGDELREALDASEAFSPHRNPSAAWAFRGEGAVVTFYSSGKCVVQGAGAAGFSERYLGGVTGGAAAAGGPKLEALEDDLIGTDESGKGDYFGPLVVAAVLVPKGQEEVLQALGVRDSKLTGDRTAAVASEAIRAGYPHEVVTIGPERYNELYDDFRNLNRLLAWATAKAIEGVISKHPCRRVLSDKFGDERLIADALARKGIEVDLEQRVRAESNPAVAAASLVARDEFVRALARLGRIAGHSLPKGAGPPVLVAGRRIYQDGGIDALRRVAKLHFKTTSTITRELF